mgnify:FL=1
MAGYVMDAPDTLKLKVFCIEAYRTKHGLTAPETMRLFDRYGVMDYLNSEVLQWQRMEDIVFYVEEFIEARS